MSDNRTSVFDEVKTRVDLVDYLANHAGAEFVSDGPGRLAACCPFHEENTPSFKVSDARSGEPWKTWHCFGACSAGGTIIDAVMAKEGFETAFEAIQLLNDLYGLGLEQDKKRYEKFRQTVAIATEQIERATERMNSGDAIASRARDFLHSRGYSDATIDHFGLAVHTEFSKAGRLAIPIYDRANHPLSISHRALFDRFACSACGEDVAAKDVAARRHRARRDTERGEVPVDWRACPHCGAEKAQARIDWLVRQHPKYMNEADYEKSRLLYNEPAARAALRGDDECLGYFIMEGYADVWACHQAGQRACSSYNGATISSWQAGEAAKLCLGAHPPRPLVLIPDFDKTGLATARSNIDMIRAASAEVEIQVIAGLDQDGDPHTIKDLGELLERHGDDAVAAVLRERRISAEEWLLNEILDATNPKTGLPFHSKTRQMELCAEILSQTRHRVSLDHMVPRLAHHWGIQEPQARDFLYANISGRDSLPAEHMMKRVRQAQEEAVGYLSDNLVIPHGFDGLDRCFPGGGARGSQLSLWLGKSGVGKTALMLQVLSNMTRAGFRCVFFSLEQNAAQLYMRMVCQVLGVTMDEASEMILASDERLAEVNEVYENLVIVDNVPTEGQTEVQDMTAGRIHKIIHDINLTQFSEPAQVVAVDHLGILKAGENAPRNVQNDELQAAGYIMQEIFHVCKATKTYFMVLQQLPKEVKQGEPIMSGDMGRGGAKQQDFADYVMGIWRPEQRAELDDDEREALRGQYKVYPAKNRHGSQQIAHLYFSQVNLRIEDAVNIMPSHNDQGLTERPDGQPVRIGPPGKAGAVGEGEAEFMALEGAAESPGVAAPAALGEPAQAPAPGGAPAPDPDERDPAVTIDNAAVLAQLDIELTIDDDLRDTYGR